MHGQCGAADRRRVRKLAEADARHLHDPLTLGREREHRLRRHVGIPRRARAADPPGNDRRQFVSGFEIVHAGGAAADLHRGARPVRYRQGRRRRCAQRPELPGVVDDGEAAGLIRNHVPARAQPSPSWRCSTRSAAPVRHRDPRVMRASLPRYSSTASESVPPTTVVAEALDTGDSGSDSRRQ